MSMCSIVLFEMAPGGLRSQDPAEAFKALSFVIK